jgi:hypothetical protein
MAAVVFHRTSIPENSSHSMARSHIVFPGGMLA